MQTAGIFQLPHLRAHGRFHPRLAREMGALPLFWAASGVEARFNGEELHLILEADFEQIEPWITVEVNGARLIRMPLARGVNDVCVFRGMASGSTKRVRLWKETQPVTGDPCHRLWVREARWKGGGFLPLPQRTLRLEFVGDSLTSGEGVIGAPEETDWVPALFSASSTWARMAADALDADFRVISQSGWGVLSGWDNDPHCALPDWYGKVCGPDLGGAGRRMGAQEEADFSEWRPHAVIVNLGTNDAGAMQNPAWEGPGGLRFRQEAAPDGLRRFEDAALDFLRQLRRRNPEAKLVWAYGMLDGPLRPQLERAVARFRQEDGGPGAYYLPLPAVRADGMGSRQHPGLPCHREAAELVAAFLKEIGLLAK